MTSKTIARAGYFVLLSLAQVIIFSQIHLFGYATACIFIIFITVNEHYDVRVLFDAPGIAEVVEVRGAVVRDGCPVQLAEDYDRDSGHLRQEFEPPGCIGNLFVSAPTASEFQEAEVVNVCHPDFPLPGVSAD